MRHNARVFLSVEKKTVAFDAKTLHVLRSCTGAKGNFDPGDEEKTVA